jgi:SAM-dependent methyltransferase
MTAMSQGSQNLVWRNAGYCPFCAQETEFAARDEWFRDSLICTRCGLYPRQRALLVILNQLRPDWRQMLIHESSPGIDYYAHQCPGYSASFYDEKTALGGKTNVGAHMSRWLAEARCEHLEKLTFKDASFDIFLTQDVMEHVFRADLAFAEIMRVLKSGGIYLFTAPKHKQILNSYPRAVMQDGKVAHLRPATYHGNPIGDGSLVTWDYGADFDDLVMRWSGYLVSTHIIRDRHLGIDGEYLEVFAIRKDEGNKVRNRGN